MPFECDLQRYTVDGKVTLQMLRSYANVGEVTAWVQVMGQRSRAVVADCSDEAGLTGIVVGSNKYQLKAVDP